MLVKLIAPYKNHPKGTVLDVSDGIKFELEAKGLIETHPCPSGEVTSLKKTARGKATEYPHKDKMIHKSPEDKE